ncbi:MAG: lamin tail domain-containing protein, partial [bacterium]
MLLLVVLSSCNLPRSPAGDSASNADVFISEINYHDGLGRPGREFIEIHNAGTRRIALTDWCIKGAGFCFTKRTLIEPGQLVVVREPQFGGVLKNSGETLRLIDAQDNVRDTVAYGSTSPWPDTADGRGYSLHRVTSLATAILPTDWTAAEPTPGEPWTARGVTPHRRSGLVINEIHYHPANDDPSTEFIELLNASPAPIEGAGWCIPFVGHCVDAGMIEPGTTIVIKRRAGLGLSRGGDVVRLTDPVGHLADIVPFGDDGKWPALADGAGHSIQRRDPTLPGVEPGNWVSAPPSEGMSNPDAGVGLLPMFVDVTHSRSPSPGEQIEVTASLHGSDKASLFYRVGFASEIHVPMARVSSGAWSARIPAQEPGALVRYRLAASNGTGTG